MKLSGVGRAAAAFVVLTGGACSRSDEIAIQSTPLINSGTHWLVVTSALGRLYARPETAAEILGHLRRGTVVTVEERVSNWYRVALQNENGTLKNVELQGWLSDRDAETATYLLQAKRMAEGLRARHRE